MSRARANGVVFELGICTNVFDAFLVRRVTVRTGAVQFAAMGTRSAIVVSKASCVKGGRSSRFGLEYVELITFFFLLSIRSLLWVIYERFRKSFILGVCVEMLERVHFSNFYFLIYYM